MLWHAVEEEEDEPIRGRVGAACVEEEETVDEELIAVDVGCMLDECVGA
jgi:hypothetical protein